MPVAAATMPPSKVIVPDGSPGSSSPSRSSPLASPAPSQTGIAAAPGAPGTPTNPPASPALRNGTIIKGHRRVPSNLRPAASYKLREKPAGADGKWVFIVNGSKLKKWEQVAQRLLKQLSTLEVRHLSISPSDNNWDVHGQRGGDEAVRGQNTEKAPLPPHLHIYMRY